MYISSRLQNQIFSQLLVRYFSCNYLNWLRISHELKIFHLFRDISFEFFNFLLIYSVFYEWRRLIINGTEDR